MTGIAPGPGGADPSLAAGPVQSGEDTPTRSTHASRRRDHGQRSVMASGYNMAVPTLCHCTRPTPDGATLCNTCTARLADALRSIPSLVEQLQITITRQTAHAERIRARSAETPLPYDHRASVMLEALCQTLCAWLRAFQDPAGPITPGAVVDASESLLRLLRRIQRHSSAAQALDEITSVVADSWRTIDTPPNRGRIPVGPCPDTRPDGAPCPGTATAVIPADGRPAYITCGTHHWETWQWTRLGRRILSSTPTPRQQPPASPPALSAAG